VNEREPADGSERTIHVVYLGLHATDALRTAKGLVSFCRTLTQPSSPPVR